MGEEELAQNKNNYDIQLIAAYGYYKILASSDNQEELAKGVEIVELTSAHFFNENLQLLLAKTYASMGHKEKARQIANELVSKNLLTEEAEKLLTELKG